MFILNEGAKITETAKRINSIRDSISSIAHSMFGMSHSEVENRNTAQSQINELEAELVALTLDVEF